MERLMTLVIPLTDTQILLGFKKTGEFGQGLINGFGGNVEQGETPEQAAKRELKEETELVAQDLLLKGIVSFTFQDSPTILKMYCYSVRKFEGTPQETKEMKPEWFDRYSPPYDRMWPADHLWLPRFLAGRNFYGTVKYDNKTSRNIISHEITTIDPKELSKLV